MVLGLELLPLPLPLGAHQPLFLQGREQLSLLLPDRLAVRRGGGFLPIGDGSGSRLASWSRSRPVVLEFPQFLGFLRLNEFGVAVGVDPREGKVLEA